MIHGSLFSGIGGFDLAAKWMSWTNLFHCEYDPFCQKVLKQHFPEAEGHGDITKTDFTKYANRIDVLTGGFPCQPVSVIGEQLGSEDERYLWPEYKRAIKEIGPGWVVPENVSGLIDWGGGILFEEICADLETLGYKIEPCILPACGVGAAHERERIWIVAHSAERRLERWNRRKEEGHREAEGRPIPTLVENRDWTEYAKSFVSGRIHGIPDRVDRTKALGNAIVPQVALQIFKAISDFEKINWFK